ncbi:MAG: DNA-binding protein WhiA [Eubacteriaceae bacterium]|nr:DNA-binding protein WhiA [Eubacteriaceae bacterium]
MRFNDEVKNYVCLSLPKGLVASESVLAGAIQSSAVPVIKGRGQVSLALDTDSAAVARCIFKLIGEVFGFKAQIVVKRTNQFGEKTTYTVQMPNTPQSEEVMMTFGIELGVQREVGLSHTRDEASARAYLAGVFLMRGYCSDPSKRCTVEFTFTNQEYARSFIVFAKSMGLELKELKKQNYYTAFSSKQADESSLLALIGANDHFLKLEDKIAMKEMKNRLHRVINCETANMNKMVDSATRQILAIETLQDKGEYQRLPETLLYAAQLRLDNPESSLSEIAKIGNISKSTLDKRLRSIIERAGIK